MNLKDHFPPTGGLSGEEVEKLVKRSKGFYRGEDPQRLKLVTTEVVAFLEARGPFESFAAALTAFWAGKGAGKPHSGMKDNGNLKEGYVRSPRPSRRRAGRQTGKLFRRVR